MFLFPLRAFPKRALENKTRQNKIAAGFICPACWCFSFSKTLWMICALALIICQWWKGHLRHGSESNEWQRFWMIAWFLMIILAGNLKGNYTMALKTNQEAVWTPIKASQQQLKPPAEHLLHLFTHLVWHRTIIVHNISPLISKELWLKADRLLNANDSRSGAVLQFVWTCVLQPLAKLLVFLLMYPELFCSFLGLFQF